MAAEGGIEGEAEYCGWMIKRGGLRKNWARRWFELRGASLIYYKDADGESGRDRKGEVNLSDCSAARKSGNADAREHELEIVADKRIYRFVAEDAEKLDAWLVALEKSIAGAHLRSPSGAAGSRAGGNDEDDAVAFDLSRDPPTMEDFSRFQLTGRETGEMVQQLFEEPVTLLLMDHSHHYCSVFLTDYRLAFMFWADVDEVRHTQHCSLISRIFVERLLVTTARWRGR